MDVIHFKPTDDAQPGGPLAVHGTRIEDAEVMASEPPEWVMLIPAGEFRGRDGRGPFRLADSQRVISETAALGMNAGIPIDYDHATDFAAPKGHPAPAAGWIRELAARDGALWGRVTWTPHGAAAISSREYRYISPVFQYSQDGEVTRLLRAGLTNNPNLYLTAISARAASDADFGRGRFANTDNSAAGAGRQQEDESMETLLEQLREILGLGDDASVDDVLAGVRALIDDGAGAADDADSTGSELSAADPARYVAVSHFQKVLGELNTLRAERATERAERAVDEAIKAGKLIPAQRQWAISYCRADFNGFAAFVAKQPAAFGPGLDGSPVYTPRPPAAAQSALTATETTICKQLGLSTDDFLGRKRSGEGDFLRLNRAGA